MFMAQQEEVVVVVHNILLGSCKRSLEIINDHPLSTN